MTEPTPAQAFLTRVERFEQLMDRPEFFEMLVAHVSSGGELVDFTEGLELPYGRVWTWIHRSQERSRRYREAESGKIEFAISMVMRELKSIAHADIRKIFNDNGTIKLPSEWPAECARAITGMEIKELFDGAGRDKQMIGQAKTVKMADKIRALELLGKNLALFIDRAVVHKADSLEDLLESTWKPAEELDQE